MTFRLLPVFLVLSVFVANVGLRAQEGREGLAKESKKEPSAEETLRKQRTYLLNLMIFSAEAEEVQLALQVLAQLVEEAELSGDDPLIVNALTQLAQSGTAQKIYDAEGNLLNDDYAVRANASALLGRLGGRRAVAGLVSVMQNDVEPVVVAVAMESLVKAKPEGSPLLIRMLAETFFKYHTKRQDGTLVRSFLYAVSEYSASSKGKLLSPYLLQAVHDISLANNTYGSGLRLKARSLILSWLEAEYPNWEDLQ